MSSLDTRVREVMTSDVVSLREEASAAEASEILLRNEISGAPVEGADGKVVGVISLRDLLSPLSDEGEPVYERAGADFYVRGWEERYDAEDLRALRIQNEGLPVRDLMSRRLHAVEEDASLSEVAARMVEHHVHRVLVLRAGKAVGMVSSLDVLRALIA